MSMTIKIFDGTSTLNSEWVPAEIHPKTRMKPTQVPRTEAGMPFLPGIPPLVRASASSTCLEWLWSTSLVAKFSCVIAAWASTPLVVAPALWPAGIADQKCTLSRSAKLPPSIATVVALTVRIVETAWLDRSEPTR